jgi:hypothetical protein
LGLSADRMVAVYGVLCCRPLSLSSVSLEYERDGVATPKLAIHCQTRQERLTAPDRRRLPDWIAEGKAESL